MSFIKQFVYCFSVAFLLGTPVFAQQIPLGRMTDWSSPGSADPFVPATALSLADFGADTTGTVPCDSSFQAALTALGGPGKLLFPGGTYLFNQTLVLPDSVILEGEADAVTLKSTVLLRLNPGSTANGILIQGSETDLGFTPGLPLTQGMQKIYVAQAANNLQPGDDIRLYAMDDSTLVYSSWAIHGTGQIFRITALEGDSVVLDKPLRRNYDSARPPFIFKQHPRRQVHLKCINLERVDATPGQTTNVMIDMATDCSLSGVESYRCNFAHVTVQVSSRVSVSNSHFREAFAYGGSGQGYGVALQFASSNCYVHDNTFTHLRHSMLLQAGVNGNVLAYNYSTDPFWTEQFLPSNSSGDVVFHGNYVYMNLVEGNVVQNIIIDNSHGINGPYNTFFRNRAELYGIFMNNSPASSQQNFVGNQVINTSSVLYGMYSLQGSDHYQYGNTVKGTVTPAGSAEYGASSLFGYSFPSYYEAYTGLPGIRMDNWQASVPLNEADYRYAQNRRSVCSETEYENPYLGIAETMETDLAVFPNPAQNTVNVQGEGIIRIELWDLLGKRCYTQTGNLPINVSSLAAGTYVVRVFRPGDVLQRKLVVSR